jgi:hypothetical protein
MEFNAKYHSQQGEEQSTNSGLSPQGLISTRRGMAWMPIQTNRRIPMSLDDVDTCMHAYCHSCPSMNNNVDIYVDARIPRADVPHKEHTTFIGIVTCGLCA